MHSSSREAGPARSDPQAPGSRYSRKRLQLASVLLIGLLVAALVGIGGNGLKGALLEAQALERQVMGEFQAGQQDLESGRALLVHASSGANLSEIRQAEADFNSAHQHFAAAGILVDSNRLVGRWEGVPLAGSYVKPRREAVDRLASASVAVADAAGAIAAIDARLVTEDPGAPGPAALLKVLADSGGDINLIQTRLQLAKKLLHQIPKSLLPASQLAGFDKLRSTVDAGITSVVELQNVLPVLVELLGANGPRTYLVEQVNPAELRAGGGFIGSFSLLTADRGNLKLTLSAGSEAIDYPRASLGQPGYVAPPGVWTQFIGEQSWDLGDSNFAPDFPTSAQAAEMFIQKEARTKADGVLSLDPDAIAAMLKVTGPIAVPEYGITVTGENFSEFVFQYENSSSAVPGKKRFLAATAVPLLGAVMKLPAIRWPALLGALNEATSARHLQAYFNDHQAEAAMAHYRWSGALNPTGAADFLLETESNTAASKANHFLERSYDLSLSAAGALLHHRLVVNLQDNAPASGVEGGMQYRCYVRLYVPAGASNVKLGPVEADHTRNLDRPPGLALVDGWFWIHAEQGQRTWTLTLEYDTPWNQSQASHSLYWQKQPGTGPDRLRVTWSPGASSFKADGQLSQDQAVLLTRTGVKLKPGQPATAHLPAVTL